MIRSRATRRQGFEQFAEAEAAGLYRLAFSLCGQRERAEDAVQDAFAEVYRRWSSLREPLAYARRVTVNATHNGWRSTSRQDRISGRWSRSRSRRRWRRRISSWSATSC